MRTDTRVSRIPAFDDVTELPQFQRGSRFVSAIAQLGLELEHQTVLDLGAGFGSIARAVADQRPDRVVAVDIRHDRLATLARRTPDDRPLQIVCANLLRAPFRSDFADVAFLVGVVEYAGLWDLEHPVESVQRRVFATAYDALKPGGHLVFASKNRFWPKFFMGDPHTGMPLVNALPRAWADALSLMLDGHRYRHHIHTPATWADLLRAVGFRHIEVYWPVPSYQFPCYIVSGDLRLSDLRGIHRVTRGLDAYRGADQVFGRFRLPKLLVLALTAALGTPITHSVLIKAQK